MPWLLPQEDEIYLVMCKYIWRGSFDWVEGGLSRPLARESSAYSSIKIPTRVNSLFPQRLILWKPSKRHLKFKWADRWRGVKGERGWGRRCCDWWGQWHAVAAEFMSQSKSEYWERGHHVILAILRIIWQCIMSEICHAKKMSMPSPAAEITTCGAARCSSTPYFMNSLWTTHRGPPHLLRVRNCQNKWLKTSVCMDSTVVVCPSFYNSVDHDTKCACISSTRL